MKICLNMIVKNEAHVIKRSLLSVKDQIDYYVIVDTGSSDNTRAVIEETLEGIPGEIHDREWVNFGHNRSEALALAQGKGDYALFMDADDYLEGVLPKYLTHDAYFMDVYSGLTCFKIKKLVRLNKPFYWKGVVHEHVTMDGVYTTGVVYGCNNVSIREGDRNRVDARTKYLRDANVLEKYLYENPKDAGSWFYLGNSYRDAGCYKQAAKAYEKRIEIGGWEEETYLSMVYLARCHDWMRSDPLLTIHLYTEAHSFRPTRMEAIKSLQNYCGRLRAHISEPNDLLFVEQDSYL